MYREGVSSQSPSSRSKAFDSDEADVDFSSPETDGQWAILVHQYDGTDVSTEPWDEYGSIHDDLPMYDGRPSGELHESLASNGLQNIEHEPLQDPVLWGREPRHEYYLMSGTVPR